MKYYFKTTLHLKIDLSLILVRLTLSKLVVVKLQVYIPARTSVSTLYVLVTGLNYVVMIVIFIIKPSTHNKVF